MPPNLWSVGRVSHAELRVWLLAADAGLNPVDSGSGTNLKLLEYAAAGLPILSTPFGGRGGLLQPGTHFAAAALADFAPALQALLAPAGADEREARARAAQRQAQQAGRRLAPQRRRPVAGAGTAARRRGGATAVRLILAVDAIFPPLTGIGRYAYELARGLAASGEPGALRYYLHGRWLAAVPGEGGEGAAAVGDEAAAKKVVKEERDGVGLRARARARLARQPLAVRAYAALAPRIAAWRLRRYGDHIFHGPNFILPPFPGPSVATVHDLSTVLHPQWHPAARVALMESALPQTLARASRLITPSEAVRGELIAHYGLAPARVQAIPMGVDGAFAPRPAAALAGTLARLGLQPGGYLLCVATLEPRKNIDGLLDAYLALPPALRRRYPLALAGAPGWHSEALTARLRQLAAGGAVRLLGYVAQGDLPALYAGARLFAFPAFYEGFGLPVLEAMASGVPVVTADRSSLPEVAGDAALLVDPADGAALREALARGLEDEPWREAARARGLARAAERSWDRCVAGTLALYRTLQP